MYDVTHAKEVLNRLYLLCRARGEYPVNMSDNSLNICRAILRHVLADRFEVRPVVATTYCLYIDSS
jgi:hypothetical protein